MYFKKLIGAVALGALAVSPVAAKTGSAKRLAVTKADESKLGEGSTIWALALLAVVIGIVVVASGEDAPTSP